MYTLSTLRNKVKRRIRQIRGTGASTEAESGYAHSDQAIDDAINVGRGQIVSSFAEAEIWANQIGVFATVENIQDYALDTAIRIVLSILYDVTATTGLTTGASVLAVDIKTAAGEQMVIQDPMYTPSDTEPYFRLNNNGIRLITSTDGAQAASKSLRVDFIGDLDDLTSGGQSSYLTNELDNMVVEWALHILLETINVQQSAQARQSFYQKAQILNQRQQGGRR